MEKIAHPIQVKTASPTNASTIPTICSGDFIRSLTKSGPAHIRPSGKAGCACCRSNQAHSSSTNSLHRDVLFPGSRWPVQSRRQSLCSPIRAHTKAGRESQERSGNHPAHPMTGHLPVAGYAAPTATPDQPTFRAPTGAPGPGVSQLFGSSLTVAEAWTCSSSSPVAGAKVQPPAAPNQRRRAQRKDPEAG